MSENIKRLISDIPVIILAGGQGTRVGSNETIPKAMIPVNNSPILFYILDHYKKAGFGKFIICTGYGSKAVENAVSGLKLDITVLDTGIENMTGSRLVQAQQYIKDSSLFCMTYADTVSDIDLADLIAFHLNHGKMATLTTVHPPIRFRILGLYGLDDMVRGFSEKPVLDKDFINGGFYVFNAAVFKLKTLNEDKGCILETSVLEDLVAKKELCAFRHNGFWQYVDTERDREKVSLWLSGKDAKKI